MENSWHVTYHPSIDPQYGNASFIIVRKPYIVPLPGLKFKRVDFSPIKITTTVNMTL